MRMVQPRKSLTAKNFTAKGQPGGGRPQKMADVLAELMARRSYTSRQTATNFQAAWQSAAGEMIAKYTRVGLVKRGTLEVLVANSVLVQELTFQKESILARLNDLLPDERIINLRWRVGPIQ
jgi:predicted nucleic acid-binding Zn ribbon protein